MKILLKILFAVSLLISAIVAIFFLLGLFALMNGGGNVLLPGLGLVISMRAVVIFMLFILFISLLITYLLYQEAFRKSLR